MTQSSSDPKKMPRSVGADVVCSYIHADEVISLSVGGALKLAFL